MKNLKVEKNVAVFEAFYPLKLSLFGVKRGFNCSIPFYKIHGFNETVNQIHFGSSDHLLKSNVNFHFSHQFKKIIKCYKRLDITWISCDSLRAWFKT